MKVLFSAFAGVVIVVVLAVVIVGSILWTRLPDMISNTLSEKLKVPVSISSLRSSWHEVDINKIRISSPPKSVLANAFTCDQIAIIAPYSNYISQHIVIEEIDLKSVYLGLEFESAISTNGNWATIMGNLKSSTDAEEATKSKRKKRKQEVALDSVKPERTLLIRKLVLTDIDVDVVYRQNGNKIHKLPRIPRLELTNISSEGGFPLNQLMNSVLGEMLKQVFIKQNLKNMFNELIKPQNQLKNYLTPFEKLFNATPEPFHDYFAFNEEEKKVS